MRTLRAAPLGVLTAAALLVTACDHQMVTGTGPGTTTSSGSTIFADQIGVGDFSTILASGTSRVAVRVTPGTLTAARVQVRQGDQITDPERIASEVTAVVSGSPDTLTLALGAIQVTFDATTKFEGWRDDHDADDSAGLDEATFISRIQNALTAGRHPTVVALRPAPSTPQDPNDSSFFAQVLRLDDAADRPDIEMNVTQANLSLDATPPPDAWLTVLGRPFAIDVTGGKTTINQATHRTRGALHFEGMVLSVDTLNGTATLADSTVLKVVSGTEFERPCGLDDGSPLTSLSAVAQALAAGDTVDAAGQGLSVATDTLDVIDVRFRIRNGAGPQPIIIGFAGIVASADTMSGKIVLANGATVDVTDTTRIDDRFGGLGSLAAVEAALGDGKTVRAEGFATLVSVTEFDALLIRFDIRSVSAHP